jgi:dipeptidyl aminopeptidase/acylaminoacyl peptidase
MTRDRSLDGVRDIRHTQLFGEIESFYGALHAPGEERVTDAADVALSPDGRFAAFTGTLYKDLSTAPATRICLLELESRELRVLPAVCGNDRLPRWSPDGSQLAFVSDRAEAGNFQLYLVRPNAGSLAESTPRVNGVVEYLRWSPDGKHLLLGVAGFGADLAGCQGGAKVMSSAEDLPAWTPELDTGDGGNLWRTLHVLDVAEHKTHIVSAEGLNVWESTWLGNDDVAVVTTNSHAEGSWYRARVQKLNLASREIAELYAPADQIGLPVASRSGRHLALIEAVCSDRIVVAGDIVLIDSVTGTRRLLDTRSVDVTHMEWRDEDNLAYCGIRGLETVLGDVHLPSGVATERWRSREFTIGGWYPSITTRGLDGTVAIREAYDVPPEVVTIRDGKAKVILSLATPATQRRSFNKATIEPFEWRARDGMEMQGWLVRPHGKGPFPLVMDIHGGPAWCARNRWQGRLRGAKVLADHGIASIYPNPRGGSGRGREFARAVVGDMGGEDGHDCLTAIDALVAAGIADPKRLGVTGISYGGYLSCWLITQDDRFAAAAPISCVSNWYSYHRTTQIQEFGRLFLAPDASEAGGLFHARSPVMFAHRVRTPTLQITGAHDQNTPPTQALEFHRSLLECGVSSVLATYPTAGHGVRGFPEVMDATTRYVGWMLRHFGEMETKSC